MTERPLILWRLWGALGAVLVGLALTFAGTLGRDVIYGCLTVLVVLAILYGVRVHRVARPAPWLLMAAGQGLWVIADLVYWLQHLAGLAPWSGLWSDLIYLSGYPVLIAGVVLLVRDRPGWRDLGVLLDSLIVTVALAIPTWVLFVQPSLQTRSANPWITLVDSAAYPLLDIVLVAATVGLYVAGEAGLRSVRLLLMAAVLLVLADVLALTSLYSDPPGRLFDALWLGSYVLWGAAALHPSIARIGVGHASPVQARQRVVRLSATTLAAFWAPALLTFEYAAGRTPSVWTVLAGSTVMFLLVVSRLLVAVHRAEVLHRERDVLQQELAHAATHDQLTGLPNRAQLMLRLQEEMARGLGRSFALLFLDLDRFKSVNDTFGHAVGDEVLRISAARIRSAVRGQDVAARIGGDEFVVLLPGAGAATADAVAERLIAQLSEPIMVPSGVAVIGASVGIAIGEAGSASGEQLLQAADEALYRAKDAGRGVALHATRSPG